MCLGSSQLWLGAPLPPVLSLLLVAGCTLGVMICALALWGMVHLRGARPTRAVLVGAMLGPLLAVGAASPVALALGQPWGAAVAGVVGAILLGAGATLGAEVARRREQRDPASPTFTWIGASLAIAGLARGSGDPFDVVTAAAVPIGFALGTAGLLGRLRMPGGSPIRFLLALSLVAVVGAFWTWLSPWLHIERNLPDLGRWPPNLVLVAINGEDAPPGGTAAPATISTLEVLAASGVSYRELRPEPAAASLLRLPDGRSLLAELRAAGYATAAIVTVPDRSFGFEIGAGEIDDRPGARRQLRESAAWMAAAPVLLGPASPLLDLLGQGDALRSPEGVVADAVRWILRWRATRAPTPFALLVDLRAPGATDAALDEALQTLERSLDASQLGYVTVWVIATESSDGGATLRALVAPPAHWPGTRRQEVEAGVWGRDLSFALLRMARSDGETPISLPGLPEPLSPPGAE
jgi:hypothetical protein